MKTDPMLQVAADWVVVLIFGVVYLGMFLGGLPRLKLDRSGVALLGAVAVIAVSGMGVTEAAQAIDLPTVLLLFAFMVISAQMRLGGFYGAVTRAVGERAWPPAALLAALISVAASLSAVFSNDVVCLAMTPLVARLCLRRGLDPVPYLVGLACAANIGSAATLIGNPQNMLIGSVLKLDFAAHARQVALPVLLSLAVLWLWLVCRPSAPQEPYSPTERRLQEPPFDAWQTAKGLAVALALLGLFLFTDGPPEVMALVGAALLLLSRRLASAEFMKLVDWPLLILFMGLFVVNHAFEQTGLAQHAVDALAAKGVRLTDPGPLMVVGALLSNLVSNVPAVMLLLPHLEGDASAGVWLTLVSTFAGNLLLVGSIANLIVADLARQQGIVIDARRHAAIGVPITLMSLALAWLCLRA